MTLRIADLEAPLEDVLFPNGRKFQPRPFGEEEYTIWRGLHGESDSVKRGTGLLTIIRNCYPGVTDEDLDSLTPRMIYGLAAHCQYRIEVVRAALKNLDAEEVEAATRPPKKKKRPRSHAIQHSSRKTSGNTSAPESQGDSATDISPSTVVEGTTTDGQS